MRILYFFRVLLLSFEALLVGAAWLAWYQFAFDLKRVAMTISLNEEILKVLMIVPIGLAVWVTKELQQLLHEDKATTRLLVAWPEYWKLKLHLWVSLTYTVIFVGLSIAPWVVRSGISTGIGLLLFVCSILGQLLLSASVYAARLRMKELLANAPDV